MNQDAQRLVRKAIIILAMAAGFVAGWYVRDNKCHIQESTMTTKSERNQDSELSAAEQREAKTASPAFAVEK